MPSQAKHKLPGYRQTITKGNDFRRLYWNRKVGLVSPINEQIGVKEWFDKKDIWGPTLKLSQTKVNYDLPDSRDIKFQKDVDEFYHERHGYTREGAMAKFLPELSDNHDEKHFNDVPNQYAVSINDQLKELSGVSLLPDITRKTSLNFSQASNRANDQMSQSSKQPPSSVNTRAGLSSMDSYDPAGNDVDRASSVRGDATTGPALPVLAAPPSQTGHETALSVMSDPPPQPPRARFDEIRNRVASRDNRSASRSYPSPRHKVEELACNRRSDILTSGGDAWKSKNPMDISYFFLYTPLLDVSYVGWKRYGGKRSK